jgi:N-acetylmuramoyl-L-alanine amidase
MSFWKKTGFILLAVTAVAAFGVWLNHHLKSRSAGKNRPMEELSELAGTPNWRELDAYQNCITRDEFVSAMDGVFSTTGNWRKWMREGDGGVHILESGKSGADLFLRFADSVKSPAPRAWKRRSQLGTVNPQLPLKGLAIAIDPGHLGGRWAQMEERWFQIGKGKPVCEGDMTLMVARLMKPKLEALGASVSLLRNSDEPVTKLRPSDLLDEASRSNRKGDLKKVSEILFYRTAEIHARAELVNQRLKPDIVICLHFNAESWGDPAHPTLVSNHHFHTIVSGAYDDDEISMADQRHDLLMKILTNVHEEEAGLAASAVESFVRKTKLPAYQYVSKNARNVDQNPYIWARNLLANRLYHCPVLYLEPYVMNCVEDYARIQAGDYTGLREVNGRMQPSIFREYADAAVEGIANYYRTRSASNE